MLLFDPIRDIFGRIIELYDIIIVVSANDKMELAIVTDLTVWDDKQYVPIIQRFNTDLTLRERKTEFVHSEEKTFLLSFDSIPVEAWNVREHIIEVHNGY